MGELIAQGATRRGLTRAHEAQADVRYAPTLNENRGIRTLGYFLTRRKVIMRKRIPIQGSGSVLVMLGSRLLGGSS